MFLLVPSGDPNKIVQEELGQGGNYSERSTFFCVISRLILCIYSDMYYADYVFLSKFKITLYLIKSNLHEVVSF